MTQIRCEESEAAAAQDANALFEHGVGRLKAADYCAAVAALERAQAMAPADRARVALGAALQGARRHADALIQLDGVPASSTERGAARVHAAFSLLALGKPAAARDAALEARALMPQSAPAHCALGEAELALGRAGAAQAAFLEAIRQAPSSAEYQALLASARRLACDAAGAAAPGELKLWAPGDRRVSLGLAVEYLGKKATFAKLPFGEWSRILAHQAGRGRQVFVVDADRRVQGFLGWAVTTTPLAEQWLRGLNGLSDEECLDGDSVIINAWASESNAANALLLAAARELLKDKSAVYFKRFYRDGRVRPMRLTANAFVAGHLARSVRRA